MKAVFAGAFICVTVGTTVCFAEEQPARMPPEWFAPPKTASELGITDFAQSPLLDGRDLPPVEERLPDDPVVSHPYERIGKYGGRARITLWDIWHFFNWEHALTISADLRNVLPNLAESWSVSEDGRVTTIRLRPGIKWSDGHPLTSDDFMFRFNHDWLDKEMQPLTNVAVRRREVRHHRRADVPVRVPEAEPDVPQLLRLLRQPLRRADALLQGLPPGIPRPGRTQRAGEREGSRHLVGDVQPVARMGQRRRAAGSHPARPQGGATHAHQDGPGAQPLLFQGGFRRQPVAVHRRRRRDHPAGRTRR